MADKIFYQRVGEGDILVLLHGFCESHEVWSDIAKDLSREHTVISIDIPGFGKSPIPEDTSISAVAERLHDLLTSITIDKVILAGHSLGGYIALAFASKFPEMLKGLGLINSTVYPDDEEKKANRLKTVDFLERHGKSIFLDTFVPGLFYNKSNPIIEEVRKIANRTPLETMIKYTLSMRDRADNAHLLARNGIPVIFIAGKHDQLVPEIKSKEQIELIGNGKGYILQESAHMSMVEQADETAKLIAEFIDSLK